MFWPFSEPAAPQLMNLINRKLCDKKNCSEESPFPVQKV